MNYSSSTALNVLESDGLTFQIAASGSDAVTIRRFGYYASSGNNYMRDSNYSLIYDNVDFEVPAHPDFATIRESDDFHQWAESQPEDIQAWVYNNPNNVRLASRAIDLFKQDIGLASQGKKQTSNKSKSSSSSAADMVSTKTTTIDATAEPKIWTQEEIAALPMDEFDRLEAELDKALEEGRVRS